MTNSTKILAACGVAAGFAAVLAMPGVGGHAVDPATASTTINANVNTAIAITAQEAVTIPTLNVNDLQSIAVAGDSKDTAAFNVATNNTKGYTVDVKGSAETGVATALTHTTDSTKSIPYQASALSAGTSGWNLTITAGPSVLTPKIADIVNKTSDTIVSTTAASDVDGDNFAVTYGAATNANQTAGAYQGQVTYTATIKE